MPLILRRDPGGLSLLPLGLYRVDDKKETGETKIGIGGIKFSPQLVQCSYQAHSPVDRSLVGLLGCLAERRINLPFLCSSPADGGAQSTFCVAATDFTLVDTLLDSHPWACDAIPTGSCGGTKKSGGPSLRDGLRIIHGVGTLTLFPHRRSLLLLGRVVELLGQAEITVHSLCTSISALAINIDYPLLDQAVHVLERVVELPDNHAPFRPEFSVRQINS